jgi:hypothetical protein
MIQKDLRTQEFVLAFFRHPPDRPRLEGCLG